MSESAPSTFADIVRSIVTLLVGLAWPAIAVVILSMLSWNSHAIGQSVSTFLSQYQQASFALGPNGVSGSIVAKQQVAQGIEQQARQATQGPDPQTKSDPAQIAPAHITSIADAAVDRLHGSSRIITKLNFTVLWIDDYPENNVGLQFALQSLGMTVLCIAGNDAIDQAFDAAGTVNVVITDMGRDAHGKRPNEPEGGLAAIERIRSSHPGIPLIIYSSLYAENHKSDTLSPPVKLITNNASELVSKVSELAQANLGVPQGTPAVH